MALSEGDPCSTESMFVICPFFFLSFIDNTENTITKKLKISWTQYDRTVTNGLVHVPVDSRHMRPGPFKSACVGMKNCCNTFKKKKFH